MARATHVQNPPAVRSVDTRLRLCTAIRQFLNSEITAFAFDESLDEFRSSDDPTVAFVVESVWYYYDDCDDHLVAVSKPAWDNIQRLLLLLESDCTIHTQSKWCWSWTQMIAAVCLIGFVFAAERCGWGQQQLFVSVPFGFASIALSTVRRTPGFETDPLMSIIHPFESFVDLRVAYESAQFQKARYPRVIGTRRIRSPFMDGVNTLQMYAAWLVLAPIPLFFQALPQRAKLTTARAVSL